MRMVGTVALDPGRAGPSAVALACDLCGAAVQATEWLRHGVRAVTRGVGAALAAHGPVMAALTASFRALSTPWAVVVASPRAGGTPYVAGFRTDAGPPRRSGAATRRPADANRELMLPAGPTAPGLARAFLRCATEEWGVDDDLAQDAAMVITELVANAVDHARSQSTLSLSLAHEGLWVAVRDARPGAVPRPAPIDPNAARGRGLQMVDALTTAWGVTLHIDGKTVWAVLGPTRD